MKCRALDIKLLFIMHPWTQMSAIMCNVAGAKMRSVLYVLQLHLAWVSRDWHTAQLCLDINRCWVLLIFLLYVFSEGTCGLADKKNVMFDFWGF